MAGVILIAIIFILVVWVLCSGSGSENAPVKRSGGSRNTNDYHDGDSYCECPSCGAPYYDGYCEECGYPDVNQGWLGENY